MIPYPTAQRIGVVKSSAHLSILASLPVQAVQALAGPGPNPLAHDKQESAFAHIKQLSPHAVQTLSLFQKPASQDKIVVAQSLLVAIKVNPVLHPVASELHSPAAVQLLQLAAQAEQAVPTRTNSGSQVKQAVAEQVKQLAPQATQLPASRANLASHAVQAVSEHVAQLVPQAVQESSSAITNALAQVVQTVAESHTLQLAPQASQAVEELIKKPTLQEVQAVAEVQVRHSVPQESQVPVPLTMNNG